MQDKEMAHSVEALESKAEKILGDAKEKAEEIHLNAKAEADKILISELTADSIDTKCHEIIQTATEEATRMKKSSSKHCDEIKASADKKIGQVVDHIVSIVTGSD